jgi:uncharacterized membrane protein YhaH (DUF805 family)
MKWFLGGLKKYAVFAGRASRTEYWMFLLVAVLIAFVVGFVDGATAAASRSSGGALVGLYQLVMFLPTLAIAVRRMHDVDHSGWWAIVPVASLLIALQEGQRGRNRFGDDPWASLAPVASGQPVAVQI